MNALVALNTALATETDVDFDTGAALALHVSREGWLQHATDAFRPHFEMVGKPLPANIRFSVGFCSTGARGRRIGECWQNTASADNHYEIFISPVLSDPIRVLDVLLHELCHAALPAGVGHGPEFRKLATAVGLTGKMTATVATPELEAALRKLVVLTLGKLPHGELRASVVSEGGPKKQQNRWLKASCTCCDYTIRISRLHAESLGAVCPEHGPMTIEGP
jgi:hypothetical protein